MDYYQSLESTAVDMKPLMNSWSCLSINGPNWHPACILNSFICQVATAGLSKALNLKSLNNHSSVGSFEEKCVCHCKYNSQNSLDKLTVQHRANTYKEIPKKQPWCLWTIITSQEMLRRKKCDACHPPCITYKWENKVCLGFEPCHSVDFLLINTESIQTMYELWSIQKKIKKIFRFYKRSLFCLMTALHNAVAIVTFSYSASWGATWMALQQSWRSSQR